MPAGKREEVDEMARSAHWTRSRLLKHFITEGMARAKAVGGLEVRQYVRLDEEGGAA